MCELFPGDLTFQLVFSECGLVVWPPGGGHFAWCPALVPAVPGLTLVVTGGDLWGSTCGPSCVAPVSLLMDADSRSLGSSPKQPLVPPMPSS